MGTQEIFPKDEASKQPLLSALQPELSFSFSQSYPNWHYAKENANSTTKAGIFSNWYNAMEK